MEGLKGCPFCGSEPKIMKGRIFAGPHFYMIRCENCEIGMDSKTFVNAEKEEKAMADLKEKWNRRTNNE